MIRFVDLSYAYWTDPEENGGPVCAFLDTITDKFVDSLCDHVFNSEDDILGIKNKKLGARLLGLVPPGFFSKTKHEDNDE